MSGPETYTLAGDGRFPNSPLPLLVYRKALPADPRAMEQTFGANDWSNGWRNGIFTYDHFHSIAHEVLGIATGDVEVRFGGPSTGQTVRVASGDVVVIPAGVAHRNMGQSDDLLVIGAYPGGAEYDLCRGDPAGYAAAKKAVAAVPCPTNDPVAGRDGPLLALWQSGR